MYRVIVQIALGVAIVGAVATTLSHRTESEGLLNSPPQQGTTVDALGISFVTSAKCATCHQAQHDAWLQSHHRHAMEHADDTSVRGNFDDTVVTRDDEILTFRREGEKFHIRIETEDGEISTLNVLYTFGWEPLQQYLIAEPGGRLQAFDVTWDTGDMQWFDLHPNETLPVDDPLHWRGLQQNWNFMCADCHSTGLLRNYDPVTDSFATTWAEITIGCESCHGAGGAHVAWAENGELPGDMEPAQMGLPVDLSMSDGAWIFDGNDPIAHWDGPSRTSPELAICGACHARRRIVSEFAHPGEPMLDVFVPSLLDEGLYRPDGRQQSEVYVLGSFLQSKMAAAGVTCSDCHEPHGTALVAQGNTLCTQCHLSTVFDSPEHHHHQADTQASACVACHMPADLYMQVDWRRDHGFRVPSSDLGSVPGVIDGCAACHDSSVAWREAGARGWWPVSVPSDTARAMAIAIGWSRDVGAATALSALAADGSQPPIFRATALSLLSDNFQISAVQALIDGLRHTDPLVRLGAVRGAAGLAPVDRYTLLEPLIEDPVKAVRVEVAATLSDVPLMELPTDHAERLSALFDELLETERLFLDRPENNYNIANHHAQQGDTVDAERSYEAALALDRNFVPAYVNLAELQRMNAGEETSIATLRRGLDVVPDAPDLRYALGLALYRQGDLSAALPELERAWRQGTGEGRYAYAYSLALDERGDRAQAISILEISRQSDPNDREILYALIYYLSLVGETEKALRHAQHLVELEPDNPSFGELVQRLGGDDE